MRVLPYVLLLLVLAEAVWFGLVQMNWQLFLVGLPVTLLISVLLYLVVLTVVEKRLPARFLVILLSGFLLGGLIGLLIPVFGYLNGFLLTLSLLSFAMGLWLRFRLQKQS